MKKTRSVVACLAMILFAASLAVAGAPSGIVAIEIPPNENIPVAIPFANAVITTAASDTDAIVFTIWKWDPIWQVYQRAFLTTEGLFADEDTAVVSPIQLYAGDAIFVSHNAEDPQLVYLAGDIVLDDDVSIDLLPGLTLLGSPYASITATDDLPQPVTYIHPILPQDDLLPLATAFWKENTTESDQAWETTRPYENVFTHSGLLPIGLVMPGETGLEIILATDKQVTLLTKDVAPDAALETQTGWHVLAENLVPTDGAIIYIDQRMLDPSSDIPFSPARYYLAVDASIGDPIQILADGNSENPEETETANTEEDPVMIAMGGGSTIYYVNAATGSDTNEGTSEVSPKATINAAIAIANEGDQIHVYAGTYPEGRITLPAGVRMVAQGRVVLQ